MNYNGTAGFALSNLQGQFNFPAGAPASEGLYDLCMCDFDGDKKVDVATANDNYKYINIYPNGSTLGTIAFPSKIAVNIASLQGMPQQKKDNVVMLDKARGMEHAFPLPEATAPITLKHQSRRNC